MDAVELEKYMTDQHAQQTAFIKNGKFPDIFGKVFDDAVHMVASYASSTNCEVRNIQRSKSFEEIQDVIRYTKNPHNPNATVPSMLPELCRFTKAMGMEWPDHSLVCCLCLVAAYADDPECLETLKSFCGDSSYTPFKSTGVQSWMMCARCLLVDVMSKNIENCLNTIGHHGCDSIARENSIKAYAEYLWVKEGKPDDRGHIHWAAAILVIDEILELKGSLKALEILSDECGQKQTNRFFRANGCDWIKD